MINSTWTYYNTILVNPPLVLTSVNENKLTFALTFKHANFAMWLIQIHSTNDKTAVLYSFLIRAVYVHEESNFNNVCWWT